MCADGTLYSLYLIFSYMDSGGGVLVGKRVHGCSSSFQGIYRSRLCSLVHQYSYRIFSLGRGTSKLQEGGSNGYLGYNYLSNAINASRHGGLSLVCVGEGSLRNLSRAVMSLRILCFRRYRCLIPPCSPECTIVAIKSFDATSISP